ncbi:MAG: DUF2478 domain-containing protein [Bacteroidetes bacterium]|nr:DUF2478 domain-containing protein [Bacteroidota bacterium]
MKSISPSAVIIGPMTGIMLEGVLVELSLMSFGMNRIAMVIGGMLAVFSSILHKAFSLILIYGFDLVKLLESLYEYAVKQIGLEFVSPPLALLIISVIYLSGGVVATLIAFRLMAKPAASSSASVRQFDSGGKALFEYTDTGGYSISLLVIILLAVIGLLLAMNLSPVWVYVPGSLVFLTWVFVMYKRAVRPLTRPKFWIQFGVITLLAAVVIQGIETGDWFSKTGLYAGLLINLRAMVILTSFAAIGTELKNPLIKTVLYKKGFASLYNSLNMAFATLPGIISHLPKLKKSWRRIPTLIREFLSLANDLYQYYASMEMRMPVVFIISGGKETGKTSFLTELTAELKKRKVRLGGFLAAAVHIGNQRTGYGLLSVESGARMGFCQTLHHPDWTRIGRYYIDPAGLEFGQGLIREALKGECSTVIIDEVGPLEMQNKGWANELKLLAGHSRIVQIWSVRDQLVQKVTRKWPLNKYEILSVNSLSPQQLADEIFTAQSFLLNGGSGKVNKRG